MDRRRLLIKSGIGERYIDMSLTDYSNPTAVEVKEHIESNPDSCMVFYGTNSESYDLAQLACRGLILSEKVKNITVVDFFTLLSPDETQLMSDKTPPLLILNYSPNSLYVNGPQYKILETVLQKYIDGNKKLYVHFPCNERAQIGDLVNPVFVDRLEKNSKVFRI